MPPKTPMPRPLASGTFEVVRASDASYVYRAYCGHDDLLYVGISDEVFGRIGQHRAKLAEWEVYAARIDWAMYRNREEASRVERHLIGTLQPRFNKIHATGRRPIWRDLPTPRRLTDHEMNWRAVCAHKGVPFLEWLADEWAAA